jgi:hypothetical protein
MAPSHPTSPQDWHPGSHSLWRRPRDVRAPHGSVRLPDSAFEVVIKTTGDAVLDRQKEIGGRDLSPKRSGRDMYCQAKIGIAVHSMKDMPWNSPRPSPRHIPAARDVRDAFVSPTVQHRGSRRGRRQPRTPAAASAAEPPPR